VKIGFLGTGLMGEPMAARLLADGIPVIAYNRTAAKLASLQQAGATIANSSEEAIAQSDCVILMLSDATAIAEVLLSEPAKQQLAGRTVICMSTISPTQSRAIRDEVVSASGEYIEAPVLGSIPEATAGKLIVMVGASATQFHKWSELLAHFGSQPRLIGEVGAASAIKLALNQLIGSLTAAFALSVGLVERHGASIETFMEILRSSALYAPTFDKKLSRMLEHNYTNPNFPTKHMLKDTNLFLAEAEAVGLNSSNLEGVKQILDLAIDMGFADADYSAIFDAIARPF
jgi:3-hydroxyisobutyrate dehydrogenase